MFCRLFIHIPAFPQPICVISCASIRHHLILFEGLSNLSPLQCLSHYMSCLSRLPHPPPPSSPLYSASHGPEVCHIFISVETSLLWEGSSLVDMPRVQRNQRALRPLKLTASTPSLSLALSLPPLTPHSLLLGHHGRLWLLINSSTLQICNY